MDDSAENASVSDIHSATCSMEISNTSSENIENTSSGADAITDTPVGDPTSKVAEPSTGNDVAVISTETCDIGSSTPEGKPVQTVEEKGTFTNVEEGTVIEEKDKNLVATSCQQTDPVVQSPVKENVINIIEDTGQSNVSENRFIGPIAPNILSPNLSHTVESFVDLTADAESSEVLESNIHVEAIDVERSGELYREQRNSNEKIKSSTVVIDLSEDSNDKNEPERKKRKTDRREDTPTEIIDLSAEVGDQDAEVPCSSGQMSVFSFTEVPKRLTGAWSCYQTEDNINYLQGCKWAPDGTCLMTSSQDNVVRVFNLPEQLYHDHGEEATYEEMVPVLKMLEADTVYDYCWYPLMSSANPDTACLAVTSRMTPVHLYDAFTGELRCSYRPYNQVDEIVAANCLSFDPFGEKLFCGFNKMIRVFDVTKPGRECQQRPTFAKAGQRGIISCISHSPAEHGLYAAGSYSRSIALYQDTSGGEMLCMFEGQQGGVTQLSFSPDGSRLYSGGRKDNEIICWDLRQPGHILFTMVRSVQTNQRMQFDITSDGRYVVSGCHDGKVVAWDTQRSPVSQGTDLEPVLEPLLTFHAHQDTANGLSLHPTLPVIATASGQRHYISYYDDSDDAMDDDLETVDNSLKLWWMYPTR